MNIEVQRDKTKAVPRRARYHSSILDAVTFKRGQKFHELSDNYIIFITEHDYFKKEMPLYEITRTIKQTGDNFKDGSFIIYVNGDCRDNSPIGKLMHDFACTKAQNMYYNDLAEVVKYYKETEDGQEFMCEIIDKMCKKERAAGRREGRSEGRKEGLIEKAKSVALLMLKAGKFEIDDIVTISGLTFEEVKALQATIAT